MFHSGFLLQILEELGDTWVPGGVPAAVRRFLEMSAADDRHRPGHSVPAQEPDRPPDGIAI